MILCNSLKLSRILFLGSIQAHLPGDEQTLQIVLARGLCLSCATQCLWLSVMCKQSGDNVNLSIPSCLCLQSFETMWVLHRDFHLLPVLCSMSCQTCDVYYVLVEYADLIHRIMYCMLVRPSHGKVDRSQA